MDIKEETLKEFNKKFPEFKKYTEDENDGYDGEIENFISEAIDKVIQSKNKEFEEKVKQLFYEFNEVEEDFECNQKVIKLRNRFISKLQELNK